MTAQLGNVGYHAVLLLVEKYVEGQNFRHVVLCVIGMLEEN